jgi:hypothetical protein
LGPTAFSFFVLGVLVFGFVAAEADRGRTTDNHEAVLFQAELALACSMVVMKRTD